MNLASVVRASTATGTAELRVGPHKPHHRRLVFDGAK